MQTAHSGQHEAVGGHRRKVNDVVGVPLFVVIVVGIGIIDIVTNSAIDTALETLIESVLIPV